LNKIDLSSDFVANMSALVGMSHAIILLEIVIFEPSCWAFIKGHEPYGAEGKNTEHNECQL